MKKGKIIFLNGVTSSGKTTIAKEIQKTAAENFYYVSNDVFFDLESKIYNHRFYADDTGAYMAEAVVLMYHFAKTLAEQGTNVVIDGMFYEADEYVEKYGKTNYDSMRDILSGLAVLMVEVYCPLDECRRRNIARGDRGENQSEEQQEIMNKMIRYDFRVDTSMNSAEECAAQILSEFYTRVDGRVPREVDAILRDVSETEKAIENGTAIVYSTPDELFTAWDKEDECE